MINKNKLKTYNQATAYTSPWSLKQRILMLLWGFSWAFFCAWTPKPFNKWRLLWLRLFGAKIFGNPFVHQSAHIQIPWNLTLHDHACLGDGAYAYTLGEIEIFEDATVAQQAYLCTGTHKFDEPSRPLQTGKITIGRSAFVGARAFIMPGVMIGEGAIVGACSFVTKNVEAHTIVAGNPAVKIRKIKQDRNCK